MKLSSFGIGGGDENLAFFYSVVFIADDHGSFQCFDDIFITGFRRGEDPVVVDIHVGRGEVLTEISPSSLFRQVIGMVATFRSRMRFQAFFKEISFGNSLVLRISISFT